MESLLQHHNSTRPVPPSFLMRSGRYFHYLKPENSELSIQDIAHGLSQICRFNGHTTSFYSVAQHCVLASFLVPFADAMAALFHDAAEAVMGDIPTPLKRLLPDYMEIEQRVERAIFARFGLQWPMPPSVKEADLIMLATEKRDLVVEHPDEWEILEGIKPLAKRIVPVGPKEAKVLFLARFADLANRKRFGRFSALRQAA